MGAPTPLARYRDFKQDAAVIVSRMPAGNLHAGLVYRFRGEVRAVHMTLNGIEDDWQWELLWSIPEIDKAQIDTVIMHCDRTRRLFTSAGAHQPSFGVNAEMTKFNGRHIELHGAVGLSCVTFVLALFRTAGIELLDIQTWPAEVGPPRDLLETLKKYPEIVASVKEEGQSEYRRIRACELLAGCSFQPPATHKQCSAMSPQINALLP